MSRIRLLLPREHGAWAMFLVPLAIGWGVAARGIGAPLLLLSAALLLYVARYPLFVWARGGTAKPADNLLPWFLGYSVAGLGLAGWLVVGYDRWLLLPLGAGAVALLPLHLYLARTRRERSVLGEFSGIIGLGLAGPAAFYAATGELGAPAFYVWLWCVLFFGRGVFYVKMKVAYFARRKLRRAGWPPWGRTLLVYQAGVVGVVVALSLVGATPRFVPFAFLPVTVQVLLGVFRPRPELNIRRLGLTQLGHSLVFAGLLAGLYHVG